jgi:hypothetical protein
MIQLSNAVSMLQRLFVSLGIPILFIKNNLQNITSLSMDSMKLSQR